MMLSSNSAWFVAQTQPQSENKAGANLIQQGFEVYLPRYLKTVRHARRVTTVKAPLFPSYIFVKIDAAHQRWRAVNSTVGVNKLVGQESFPASLPTDVVESLKKRAGANGLFEVVHRRPSFKAGDLVRVCDGALNSCTGIFDARTDRDRVAVLLDILGRKSRVILNVQSIEAA